MALTLVDHGYAFKKIMQGKRWIGRVAKMGDGSGYIGVIGNDSIVCPTELEAFREIGARYLGVGNYAQLRENNRRVRFARTVQRRKAQHAMMAILAGDFRPLDELFKKGK